MVDHILLKVQSNPDWIIYFIFVISLGKSVVIVSTFLPPAYITLLTLIIISDKYLNDITTWITITIGSFFGSIICHFIGYMIRTSNQKKMGFIFEKYDRKIKKIKYVLRDQGKSFLIIFLSRFLAVFRYLVPLVSGMMNVKRIHKYFFFYLFSSSIWSFFLILASNLINFFS
ncbi:DedA family protein [Candidatus Riesia pediculicola]|uniref:VTT domain-containing protein n=2 Tax=Candidatus Riesia pediculicola TaxID=401619 RepID=D4G900_RIEPU|nr:VTT domain-containing protein [Candidatus Riesia pediculicola]ADD79430.1 conserved hypothetical protein [Candidatus Riesia pediculicola USDA]ARC54008.1 hypothetical protein AOE55_02545 [Candidatus Riesia pediculicola]QOJ86633.1 VTT domain-containing protein [Candidatus Riesia pediculicola]